MQSSVSKTKMLVREGLAMVGVGLLLAIPTYGFTVPLYWAVIAHTGLFLLYIGAVVLFGPSHVIEAAIPLVLTAVLCALLSHGLQHARQRVESIKQEQVQKPIP